MYLFLIITLGIFVFSHILVSHFFITSFSIIKYKYIIYLVVFLLSLSFFLSAILVHLYDNSLVRGLYYATSTWLGFFSNLLFSFFFVYLLVYFFKFLGLELNVKFFTSFAVLISILGVFYGIYNANNPIIKNVDIEIKNLPESWKTKKIVFISDVHIGAIIRENFLEKLSTKINSLDPDLIFITGDFFDGTDGKLDHLVSSINSIQAKEGIYYVNGNHETYIGNNLVKDILSQTKIKILEDQIIMHDQVQIVGLNYHDDRSGKQNIQEKLDKLEGFNKNTPSILLYHAPVFIKNFTDFGINLQLSGHTHKGQIWPYSYLTKFIYKDKDYGLYSDGNYNLYTTNGVGTWGPPLRIGNSPEIVVLNLK